jgi:hypothetical protein
MRIPTRSIRSLLLVFVFSAMFWTVQAESNSGSITDWKIRSHSLCFFGNSSSVAGFDNLRSCGIWVCMTSAIYKQLKKNGGILILDDAFSTNGENATNCLARPTRDWLLKARGRNARRTGNFREGERQHVIRGMWAEV